jgi:hypothetical protein
MNIQKASDFHHLLPGKQIEVKSHTITSSGAKVPSGRYTVAHMGDKVHLINHLGNSIEVGTKDKSKGHWDHVSDPLSHGFWDTPAVAFKRGA